MKRTALVISSIGLSCLLLSACQSTPAFDAHKASQARLKLGLAYLAMQHYAENNSQLAYQNLALALQHDPKNLSAQLGLALYYQQVGDKQQAEQHYQQLLQQAPEQTLYHSYYATFLCNNGQYQQAQQHFAFGMEHKQPRWYADNLEQAAYCAIKQNDRQQAKVYFKQLFAYDPARELRIRQSLAQPSIQNNPVVRFLDSLMLQS